MLDLKLRAEYQHFYLIYILKGLLWLLCEECGGNRERTWMAKGGILVQKLLLVSKQVSNNGLTKVVALEG